MPDLKHKPKSCLFLPGRLAGKRRRHGDGHGAHVPSGADPAGSLCRGRLPRARLRQHRVPARLLRTPTSSSSSRTKPWGQALGFAIPCVQPGEEAAEEAAASMLGILLPWLSNFFFFKFYLLGAKFPTRHKPELFLPAAISGSAQPAPREPQPLAEDAGSQPRSGAERRERYRRGGEGGKSSRSFPPGPRRQTSWC